MKKENSNLSETIAVSEQYRRDTRYAKSIGPKQHTRLCEKGDNIGQWIQIEVELVITELQRSGHTT